MSFRIKRDDLVEVIAGRDKGLRGKVLAVYPAKQRVIVEGINLVKRHQRVRQTSSGQEGGIIEREAPLHLSNVMLVDPKTDRPTRIGAETTPDGVKQRVAKKSGTPV
jgi:large subunit ribosomal protein L24